MSPPPNGEEWTFLLLDAAVSRHQEDETMTVGLAILEDVA